MKDLALILVLRLVVYTQPLLYLDGPVSAGSDSINTKVLLNLQCFIIQLAPVLSSTVISEASFHAFSQPRTQGIVGPMVRPLGLQGAWCSTGISIRKKRRRSPLYETKCQWEAVKWNWRQPCSVPEPGPNELLSLAPNLLTRKKV